MKKRIFAALAASVMLCGVLTAPAAAETTYKKGDVNMDGEIGPDDAQLALIDYVEYLVAYHAHTLTDEQIELADIDGESQIAKKDVSRESKLTLCDAQGILMYYTECLADSKLKDTDIQTWYAAWFYKP